MPLHVRGVWGARTPSWSAAVEVTAFKKSEDGQDIVIRLFEPTGLERTAVVKLPAFGERAKVRLKGFELRTLRFNRRARTF